MTIESALRQPANDGDVAATLRVQQVGITHEGATRATPEAITFDVRRGEVVLLLGPSGSGKSTLALSLNGLIPHALPAELAGTVTVAGLVMSIGCAFAVGSGALRLGVVLLALTGIPDTLDGAVDELVRSNELWLLRPTVTPSATRRKMR